MERSFRASLGRWRATSVEPWLSWLAVLQQQSSLHKHPAGMWWAGDFCRQTEMCWGIWVGPGSMQSVSHYYFCMPCSRERMFGKEFCRIWSYTESIWTESRALRPREFNSGHKLSCTCKGFWWRKGEGETILHLLQLWAACGCLLVQDQPNLPGRLSLQALLITPSKATSCPLCGTICWSDPVGISYVLKEASPSAHGCLSIEMSYP